MKVNAQPRAAIRDPDLQRELRDHAQAINLHEDWLSSWTTVKRFGPKGDGVTDDTKSLQAFYDDLKRNGGVGYIEPGTYGVTARIYTTGGSKPFAVIATAPGVVIKRISNFNASVVEINETDGVAHIGIEIDCQHQTYSNGNHGLVYSDCDEPLAESVTVRNHKNSAVFMYATTADTKTGAVMRNCKALGNSGSPANNGLLIAEMDYSRIENGYAEYCSGSPGYGLQLKNRCRWSSITGRAKNCVAAAAFGNDTSSEGVTDSYVNVELSENCSGAFAGSYAYRNTVHIGTVLSPNTASLNAVSLEQCSGNTVRVGVIKADGSGQNLVRLRTGCSDNFIRADVLYRTLGAAGSAGGTLDSGVTNNQISIGRIYGATVTRTDPLWTDNSGSQTNILIYDGAPAYFERSIASGAISVPATPILTVVLDTEGAAASDDLDTITGPQIEGQVVRLRTKANTRDVVVKHNTGNILLNGSADFTLDAVADSIQLVWNSGAAKWVASAPGSNNT